MRSNLDRLTARQKFRRLIPWAALTLALDLTAKWLVLRELELYEVRPVTSFFNLVLVENKGAAFSLLSGDGDWQGLKMALLAGVAMIPLGYFFASAEKLSAVSALGLILGGALGNVHDRLSHNGVVDFLDFHLYGRHWPAFNLADAAIVAGVAALLWVAFREGRGSKVKS